MSRTQIDLSLVPSAAISIQNINNILDNGGFEIWQRGTTFNSVGTTYTADRWRSLTGGIITANITRESSTIKTGSFAMKAVITSSASGGILGVSQLVENFASYANKTITFSMWVNTNIALTQIYVDDGTTQTFSASHAGDGVYRLMTVTATIGATPSQLLIGVIERTANVTGTMYFDDAMVVIGSNTTPTFVPTNPEVDLARCQRFYEVETLGMSIWSKGSQDSTFYNLSTMVNFNVSKRIAPTVVLSWIFVREDPTGVDNQAAYTKVVENVSVGRFTARAFKTVAGNPPGAIAFTWTASADL